MADVQARCEAVADLADAVPTRSGTLSADDKKTADGSATRVKDQTGQVVAQVGAGDHVAAALTPAAAEVAALAKLKP